MADQAQQASVRRQGDATPGPRLGEIIAERLKVFGADPDDPQWDAKKRADGSWLVQLAFITGGRLHTAEWVFDPRRRHVLPADDNAARISLPGTDPAPASPGLTPAAPLPGEATVTHLAPRLSTASGHGPSGMGNSTAASAAHGSGATGNALGNGHGSGERPRHERPGSTRPVVPEPNVADREAAQIREPQPREPRQAEAQAAAQARQESSVPSAARDSASAAAVPPAAPAAPAAPLAETVQPPQAEAAEQATRQGRKAARGRRSSVPSWDEIMFGNSRERD